jgi:hypothetical protein
MDYYVTQWINIRSDKLIVAQVHKKYQAAYGTRRLHSSPYTDAYKCCTITLKSILMLSSINI